MNHKKILEKLLLKISEGFFYIESKASCWHDTRNSCEWEGGRMKGL